MTGLCARLNEIGCAATLDGADELLGGLTNDYSPVKAVLLREMVESAHGVGEVQPDEQREPIGGDAR